MPDKTRQKLDEIEAEQARRAEEVERARRAHSILNHDLFKAAVEAVKDKIWRDFASTDPGTAGDEQRRMERMELFLLDELVKKLKRHMETGRMAEDQIGRLEKFKERVKKVIGA